MSNCCGHSLPLCRGTQIVKAQIVAIGNVP